MLPLRLILNAFIFLFIAFGLSYSKGTNFANDLFKEGDYLRAIGEYKRLVFFSNDEDSIDIYQYQMGECYRKLGDFTRAMKIYNKLLIKGINIPHLRKRIIFSSSICALNTGYVETVRLYLEELQKDVEIADSVNYIFGLSYLKERENLKAEAIFEKISDPVLKTEAFHMLTMVSRSHFTSPKVALILSTFIPGAGQVYTGKPFAGFISFSLNLSLGYLSFKSLKADRKLDAFLIFYFGIQRFYLGNLENAQKYAVLHNQKILDRITLK
ncbi:MAG: hypothetical protein B5M53_05795 [Candidatus Cloacimonas sp. 4484_209]|nr:MAG: hypothetical protein B5M53_05795 [Candidatus Cloacimonas sp. 4484_209]